MSWVTVIWSMIASACLTLALMNALVWLRQREAWGNLVFSLSATMTACVAACEMWMMRTETTAQFGTALRWLHLPAWAMILALIGFVRLYLRAGRPWLAWAVGGLRTLSLVLNFLFTPNLNFREITALKRVPFLGESVSVAQGVANPWMMIGQASLLLLVVFVVDATITVWRRGDRRRALILGGGMVFFVVVWTAQVILVLWEVIRMPITASFFYTGIVLAMGCELSRDVLRAAELSKELRENEQRMSLAADAANFGIWIRDLVRNEIWASGKWRELFGFAPSERLEMEAILQRLHPDDREMMRQTLAGALAGGGGYETEYRLLLPDGRLRWMASHGRVEFDGHGQPVLIRGASRDCTARKLAEQETLLLRQEVAHVGRVSMMGQLASALAHEINQPLGAILRNAEAAELFMQHASPDLDEIRAILADIRKDDLRAGTVIDRMRALLKRRDLDPRPLDAAECAGDAAGLVQAEAASRNVKLELEMPGDLPPVRGDRVHLQQVLLNLILNGMDALNGAARKDRRVTVSARLGGVRTVEFAVRDTGHGIPADQLAQVFDPFFTTKPNGMGMGLAISRTIIEAHGGRLWAENGAGGGATFRFTLPVVEETAAR